TRAPFIIFILMLSGMVNVLMAQVREPFKSRFKTPMAIHGDFALLGNTVVKLAESESGQPVNHNGDGVTYIDEDNDDATLNSSRAKHLISNEIGVENTCTKVIYMSLYRKGRSASSTNLLASVSPYGTHVADRLKKDKMKIVKERDSYVYNLAKEVLFPE